MKFPFQPQSMDLDTVRDRLTTIIGFVGLLLGLLVTSITSIDITKYQDVEPWLSYAFLVASGCLLVCIIIALVAYLKITNYSIDITADPSGDLKSPVDLIYTSIKWLTLGLLSITLSISLLITKSFIETIVFFILIGIIIVYEL